jgi:hypothetical protein
MTILEEKYSSIESLSTSFFLALHSRFYLNLASHADANPSVTCESKDDVAYLDRVELILEMLISIMFFK